MTLNVVTVILLEQKRTQFKDDLQSKKSLIFLRLKFLRSNDSSDLDQENCNSVVTVWRTEYLRDDT